MGMIHNKINIHLSKPRLSLAQYNLTVQDRSLKHHSTFSLYLKIKHPYFSLILRRKHPYIQSVCRLAELVTQRIHFLPFHNDVIFALSPTGFRFRQHINIAHKFTRDVIANKKKVRAKVNVGINS